MVANHSSLTLDATRISPHLYQGGFPEPFRNKVKDAGFDLLVLCAMECQPPSAAYAGVDVIHCPLDDGDLPEDEWLLACKAGDTVARALRKGKRVLVTCAQGRNRSGLVVALALHRLVPDSSRRIIRRVQSKRENALTNRVFVDALLKLRPATLEAR